MWRRGGVGTGKDHPRVGWEARALGPAGRALGARLESGSASGRLGDPGHPGTSCAPPASAASLPRRFGVTTEQTVFGN